MLRFQHNIVRLQSCIEALLASHRKLSRKKCPATKFKRPVWIRSWMDPSHAETRSRYDALKIDGLMDEKISQLILNIQ